jgi:hypothetical protein
MAKRGFPLAKSPEERFWREVGRGSDAECWLWTGAKSGSMPGKQYGYFNQGKVRYSTHRFSYQLHHGPIPAGMFVCHRCDTPSCVNPAHLFLGTPSDNMRDKYAKDRSNTVGQTHPFATLTDEDVYAIRADARSHRDVARDFNTSESNVRVIRKRCAWKHLPEARESV